MVEKASVYSLKRKEQIVQKYYQLALEALEKMQKNGDTYVRVRKLSFKGESSWIARELNTMLEEYEYFLSEDGYISPKGTSITLGSWWFSTLTDHLRSIIKD